MRVGTTLAMTTPGKTQKIMNLNTIWSDLDANMDIVSDIGFTALDKLAANLGLAPGLDILLIEKTQLQGHLT